MNSEMAYRLFIFYGKNGSFTFCGDDEFVLTRIFVEFFLKL